MKHFLFIPNIVGKNNVAEMLIENGANVNIVGQDGWRPIHVAIFHGKFTNY